MAPLRLTVLAFLSPFLVGFSVFFGYPLVMSAWLSLFSYDLLTPARWVGLMNYRYMFGDDPQIWPAITNTLWLVVFAVPLTVLFAFGIAMLLTRARVSGKVFRTVFYLPALVPPVMTLGFVYLLNLDRPGQRDPRLGRDRGAAGSTTRSLVEAVAGDARPLGRPARR